MQVAGCEARQQTLGLTERERKPIRATHICIWALWGHVGACKGVVFLSVLIYLQSAMCVLHVLAWCACWGLGGTLHSGALLSETECSYLKENRSFNLQVTTRNSESWYLTTNVSILIITCYTITRKCIIFFFKADSPKHHIIKSSQKSYQFSWINNWLTWQNLVLYSLTHNLSGDILTLMTKRFD